MNMVYVADIQSLADKSVFEKAYISVSEYRRQKVDKMKHQEDKMRSLGAGLLLQKALYDFGIDEKKAVFETNQNGKPHILHADRDSGLPPFHFNLSHSGDYAMCVIGDNPAGCDVERVRKIDLKIADRFFAPSEIELIKTQPTSEAKINTFFRLWTLKESYIKAEGQGLSMGLNTFSVQPDSNKILRDNVEVACSLYEFDVDKFYKFSACILGPGKLSNTAKIITLL
jgi:4'-phosphopantetheinyl transferase